MNPEWPTPGALLRAYALPAKKRFGQNFLVDPSVLDRIVGVAGVDRGMSVMEIGPGPGTLTTRLLAAGASVLALELDLDAVTHLQRTFANVPAFQVVHADATVAPLHDHPKGRVDAVVANLPYHVATPILFRLLDELQPPRMALMFQREVAERVVCAGAHRDFGPLGVASNLDYDTRIALRLKPGAFRPSPAVDSAVVSFVRRLVPWCDTGARRATRALARHVFEKRRKMLRASLAGFAPDPHAALAAAGIDETARPEALTLGELIELARACRSQLE